MARSLGVTQKSAWFMLHRIRLAMQTPTMAACCRGDVEVDETYIGGKARNMHAGASARRRRHRQAPAVRLGKIAVMGLLERHPKDGSRSQHGNVVATTDEKAAECSRPSLTTSSRLRRSTPMR